MNHSSKDIINIFNQLFEIDYNTQLIKGDDEPIYLPAFSEGNATSFHHIIFAHGYYASALHEIAHWCVAGSVRRLEIDYGYWYCPDGRSASKQAEFEALEIKPQALESLFCAAAGFKFKVSCDNLKGDFEPDHHTFSKQVQTQALQYIQQGIPLRAAKLITALQHFYQREQISLKSVILAGA